MQKEEEKKLDISRLLPVFPLSKQEIEIDSQFVQPTACCRIWHPALDEALFGLRFLGERRERDEALKNNEFLEPQPIKHSLL